VVVRTESSADGQRICETEWTILFRNAGGFGGAPPPKKEDLPAVPKGREPDVRVVEATTPEQALLYRLSGDRNPLHADPAFAESVGFPQGPILHGLATYGFAARAVVNGLLGGDASRLARLDAQFRKPVWPGDVLVTDIYRVDGGRVAIQTSVEGRPDPVLTAAWAVVTDG
jgi:acyl dehydratase